MSIDYFDEGHWVIDNNGNIIAGPFISDDAAQAVLDEMLNVTVKN